MVWWPRRERHVCSQVTAGEVSAALCAVAAQQHRDEIMARGPMIESLAEELEVIRTENHFAARFRSAFEGGGG